MVGMYEPTKDITHLCNRLEIVLWGHVHAQWNVSNMLAWPGLHRVESNMSLYFFKLCAITKERDIALNFKLNCGKNSLPFMQIMNSNEKWFHSSGVDWQFNIKLVVKRMINLHIKKKGWSMWFKYKYCNQKLKDTLRLSNQITYFNPSVKTHFNSINNQYKLGIAIVKETYIWRNWDNISTSSGFLILNSMPIILSI